MSDELLNQPNQIPEDDVNTTPPNPGQNSAKSGWSMPEPVFRKTSGYLPQGFEKKFSQDEVKSDVDDDTSTASMSRPNELSDVEPQPEISEFLKAESHLKCALKKKSLAESLRGSQLYQPSCAQS